MYVELAIIWRRRWVISGGACNVQYLDAGVNSERGASVDGGLGGVIHSVYMRKW